MGSESTDLLPTELPVIDLSKEAALTPGTPEWDLAKVKVRDALKEFGCFKALYRKVQSELLSSFFVAVEELFNLPSEIKQRNVSKTIFHGYRKSNPVAPLPESLGFDDPEVDKLWPQGKPTIRSLKLWVVLRLYGLENLQNFITNHIKLAAHFEGLAKQDQII